MPKSEIREVLLAKRKQLPAGLHERLSELAQLRLAKTSLFQGAGCIALYSPVHNEVGTETLFVLAQKSQKRVCYPRVVGERMVFVEVESLAELQKGHAGILEPAGDTEIPATLVDLVVVPGVAFDLYGHRLGYGKGFYDRELHCSGYRGKLAALCFDMQLQANLPAESHDVPMHLLVTESQIITPPQP